MVVHATAVTASQSMPAAASQLSVHTMASLCTTVACTPSRSIVPFTLVFLKLLLCYVEFSKSELLNTNVAEILGQMPFLSPDYQHQCTEHRRLLLDSL